jgi:hypothetical protein
MPEGLAPLRDVEPNAVDSLFSVVLPSFGDDPAENEVTKSHIRSTVSRTEISLADLL